MAQCCGKMITKCDKISDKLSRCPEWWTGISRCGRLKLKFISYALGQLKKYLADVLPRNCKT